MTAISGKCRDYRHDLCKGCAGCTCHHLWARTALVCQYAVDAGIPAFAASDLMAHLRTQFGHHTPVDVPLDVAASATELVIDLGWRPVVRMQYGCQESCEYTCRGEGCIAGIEGKP